MYIFNETSHNGLTKKKTNQMNKETSIKLFEEKKVRSHSDEESEKGMKNYISTWGQTVPR